MNFPSREIVERVRREYPAGTRVELVQMDDRQEHLERSRAWMILHHF